MLFYALTPPVKMKLSFALEAAFSKRSQVMLFYRKKDLIEAFSLKFFRDKMCLCNNSDEV